MRVFERGSARCELEATGAIVTTRVYADGALVDESSTAHTSAIKAKWECDCLCRARIAAGFVEATPGVEPGLSQHELESALVADPENLETYLVYADWLSERGDPRGQLIALQHAIATTPRFGHATRRDQLGRAEATLLFQHAGRFWGALGETIIDIPTQRYAYELIDATWRLGFLRAVTIGDVRMSPVAHGDAGGAADVAWLIRQLADLDIAVLLERLSIAFAGTTGVAEAVAGCEWPALKELDLGYCRTVSRLLPLLDNNVAPRLTRLEVGATLGTDELCEALARTIAPRLTALSLTYGQFSHRSIDALVSGRFAALQSVTLTGTGLPGDARARLERVVRTVNVEVHRDDHDPERPELDDDD